VHVKRSVGLVLACLLSACSPTAASPSVPPPSVTVTPTPSESGEPADVALETLIDDLSTPIGLVAAPGDIHRAFIVEQTGLVHVLRDGERTPTPFIDLRDQMVRFDTGYDERGLLGLAFHPDYASNGRLFVYYSTPTRDSAEPPADHTNRVSEFHVRPDEPDQADPGSERIVLEFEQPQPNHSGGAFGFGPDGFLYLGTGDGGGRGDADEGHSPQGNAQDPEKLNGKVLRIDIDVDGVDPYAIPDDNPFATDGGRPEIYALGFRNPWRLSWEPAGNRRLLVSDVGYGRYEEVDDVIAGGNYGWRIKEGAHCLDVDRPLEDVSGCPTMDEAGRPLIDPIIEYTHQEVGLAVVGGYVYRGQAIPALTGRYVFADYSADWTSNDPQPRGSLLVAEPGADDALWDWRRLAVASDELDRLFVTGLGEDASGELYVMARRSFGPIGQTGFVFRIVLVS
jgi:glucose/arabinose dehydrogenase